MDVIKKSISGLLVFGALAVSGNCLAQKKTVTTGNHGVQFYFDKPITLDSLTKYVHTRSKIRFSFNSSKVKGDKVIYLKKGTYSIELLLQEIRKNTSLYYSMYNGYVIFQDNPPKQKTKPPVSPARHEQVLSHRKRGTASNKGKNRVQPGPGRGVEGKAITNAPPQETNITTGQPRPVIPIQAAAIDSVVRVDSSFTNYNRVVPIKTAAIDSVVYVDNSPGQFNLVFPVRTAGIDSVVYVDKALTNKNEPSKSSNTINASLAPAIGKKKERRISNRVQNKRDNSGYGKMGWPLNWQYGLQWNATVPPDGFKYYFTGANNRSQPYNLLIPGIWLSNRFNDKHEVLLMVKPAGWYFYNNKEFSHATGPNGAVPDTLIVRKSNRLLKTADIYAGLQYNYHINENWMVGAGIGYHRRGRALILHQKKRVIDSVQLPDTMFTASTDTASRYLATGFLTGRLEIAYHFGAVDIGVSMLMPITNPFTKHSSNQSRPLNGQIFLRWRIKRTKEE